MTNTNETIFGTAYLLAKDEYVDVKKDSLLLFEVYIFF